MRSKKSETATSESNRGNANLTIGDDTEARHANRETGVPRVRQPRPEPKLKLGDSLAPDSDSLSGGLECRSLCCRSCLAGLLGVPPCPSVFIPGWLQHEGPRVYGGTQRISEKALALCLFHNEHDAVYFMAC